MKAQTSSPAFVQQAQTLCNKIVRTARMVFQTVAKWWKSEDSYQYLAHGWAVSGFVFALINLFAFGFLPVLSYIAVVFCAVALFRGNRSWLSPLGIVIGLIGISVSSRLYHTVLLYSTDGAAFKDMLTEFMTQVQSFIASVV